MNKPSDNIQFKESWNEELASKDFNELLRITYIKVTVLSIYGQGNIKLKAGYVEIKNSTKVPLGTALKIGN